MINGADVAEDVEEQLPHLSLGVDYLWHVTDDILRDEVVEVADLSEEDRGERWSAIASLNNAVCGCGMTMCVCVCVCLCDVQCTNSNWYPLS